MSPPDVSSDHLAEVFASRDGFKLLARTLPDALLVLDAEGVVIFASVASRSIFGRAAESLLGQPFSELVTEADRGMIPRVHTRDVGACDFRTPDGVWLNAAFLHSGVRGFHGGDVAEALGPQNSLVLAQVAGPADDHDPTALLCRALEATGNAVVVSDNRLPDQPLTSVNDRFCEITGYDRDEALGQNCRFLQCPPGGDADDEQAGVAELRRAIQAQESTRVILRNYRRSGERFYNELYISPVADRAGQITHYVGVQNDITDRVTAERETLSRTDLLAAFFDGSPTLMGLVERDDAGLIHRMANRTATELYDTPSDGIAGARARELGFTERETDRWDQAVEESARSGAPVTLETTHPWDSEPDDTKTRHLRITVSPVAQVVPGEGQLFSYVGEDVTTARRLELERAMLAAAVESAADAVVITTAGVEAPEPTIIYANPAHETLYGYRLDEVVGHSPRMFQGALTDRTELDRVRRALLAGESVRAEVTNYRKDGRTFQVEWQTAPVYDAAGTLINWVATLRDITERRRLEREVVDASGRVQERMARELHDGIGPVLTGASMHLHALRTRIGRGDEDTDTLTEAAEKVQTLIEGAHAQARAVARGLSPVEASTLGELVRSLAADVALVLGVACDVVIDEKAGDLSIDTDWATQLFRIGQEAATNAVRHGGATSLTVRVEARENDHVAFALEDDGTGLPDAGDRQDGLGLRTMAYRARQIGGVLEAERRVGGGTVVRVQFDLRRRPADS